ncbi:hypothetical protein [Streptomyces sp. MST-110588]|uniref:hypothetical protein n=1 Tax=Streptomyces sp. MST-110588 TaxID=2833628 RepID=UPI001F5CC075|nr:hypothetical protein [Streptomyces sp. MST-110588]UNO43032.1 hypothetical protein KGS77_30410 [Streptomyces sp. MST-110588]
MLQARTVRRAAVAAALAALAVTTSATAEPVPPDPAPSDAAPTASHAPAASQERGGNTASAVDRVADFYGSYIDAVHDAGHGRLAKALREHYLTRDLNARLTQWEKQHKTDGVLYARKAPGAWRVTYEDSGMGHAWTQVRLTWGPSGHPHYTYLTVQSDLATSHLSDIRPAKSA